MYGASTKGNTILQWCNIDNSIIDYAAERNPDKYGAMTLGTNIPIISEADSRAMNPDYYLVLPWHFKAEFLEREKETLEKGIGLIFPLPKIEIYKNNSQESVIILMTEGFIWKLFCLFLIRRSNVVFMNSGKM
ncbi:methyltransferase C-terminal domain-containing protein [Paraflavitalea speifideaquila]|uniref:methyltransferase C-terminal domain-containing protein n=1 Tax=Paraflavitalea speifideaquila TaxID=3076558 RepID=UPI0028E70CBA|nr:methyltransferase C-terminal domain-containing protein [Paraflavitalea speifideiaquila]